MKNKPLFILSSIGALLALVSAFLYLRKPSAQSPVFAPAANPYGAGIYASGIIESDQADGENININPDISGAVTRILVTEGSLVHKGQPLLTIDDSVQRAITEQQRSQAEASLAVLEELKAEPRPETLAVALAQVENARATLKTAEDQLAKQEKIYALDPNGISQDILDNSRNAAKVAATALSVVEKQCDLLKAGAWSYEITNQAKQYAALARLSAAAEALLAKYTLVAPVDGVVLSIHAAVGSYASPQGAYGTYTEAFEPLIVMSAPQTSLQVRCYVDEILVHRLPDPSRMVAKMFIQGTGLSFPLEFVRLQPYVSPKIELSDQREERVDVRVLPVIFRFAKPADATLYPGQLVDVYIGER
jgi:HlyD family secretion protein